MPENAPHEDDVEVDEADSVDPKYRSFEPPAHPSLRDPKTNPRGVRHIAETAQDQMTVADRPRYQAAQSRRSAMIAAARRRLRTLGGRRSLPPRDEPREPEA